MATIPTYTSKEQFTKQMPDAEVSTKPGEMVGEAISNLGTTVEKVGKYFYDLDVYRQQTENHVKYNEELADINKRAEENQDVSRLGEFEKEHEELNKRYANKIDDAEGQAEFNRSVWLQSQNNIANMRDMYRRKTADQSKANLYSIINNSTLNVPGTGNIEKDRQSLDRNIEEINKEVDKAYSKLSISDSERAKYKHDAKKSIEQNYLYKRADVNPEQAVELSSYFEMTEKERTAFKKYADDRRKDINYLNEVQSIADMIRYKGNVIPEKLTQRQVDTMFYDLKKQDGTSYINAQQHKILSDFVANGKVKFNQEENNPVLDRIYSEMVEVFKYNDSGKIEGVKDNWFDSKTKYSSAANVIDKVLIARAQGNMTDKQYNKFVKDITDYTDKQKNLDLRKRLTTYNYVKQLAQQDLVNGKLDYNGHINKTLSIYNELEDKIQNTQDSDIPTLVRETYAKSNGVKYEPVKEEQSKLSGDFKIGDKIDGKKIVAIRRK